MKVQQGGHEGTARRPMKVLQGRREGRARRA